MNQSRYFTKRGNRSGFKTLDKLAEHPGVREIYSEGEDGIWVEFIPGYRNSYDEPVGCLHGIHEWNVRDVLRRKNHIVKCDCKECKEYV